MPWYFSFYATWKAVESSRALDVYFLRYEDLIKDPINEILNILIKIGYTKTVDEVKLALDKTNNTYTRKNIGRVGRGMELLAPIQFEALHEMAALYNGIDFSPVGLV